MSETTHQTPHHTAHHPNLAMMARPADYGSVTSLSKVWTERFERERELDMKREKQIFWKEIVVFVLLGFLVWLREAAAQETTPPGTAQVSTAEVRETLARAESLYVRGRADEARQILIPVVRNGSTDLGVLTLYGFTLVAAQQYQESEQFFRRVLQSDSTAIGALLGLGMVQRATARYGEARETYARAVRVAPDNAEARRMLERTRWERKTELTVGGGQTSTDAQNGGDWEGVIRTRFRPRLDLSFALARHELQEVSPNIGAVTPAIGDANETQVQSGFVFRPNSRVTIATTGIYRNTQAGNSYMLWPEAVVALRGPVSLLFGMRPGYDDATNKWSNAVEVGTAIRLPREQGLTLRMLQTSRRELEPPVTFLANYEAVVAPRFRIRAGGAHGNGTDFRFTSVFGGVTGMIVPGVGVTLDYGRRTGTFARHNIMGGVVVGW